MTLDARTSEEDRNLSIFHQVLREEGKIPPLSQFLSLGRYHDLCERLYQSRVSRGVDVYRTELVRLFNNLKQPTEEYKQFFQVLCGIDESLAKYVGEPIYAGTLLSDVQCEPIEWIWKHRLARRKAATLDGDPGLGKSTLMVDLAARITTGREMPDEPEGSGGVDGGVVIISPEDGLADTIRPRAQLAGADLTRISVIQGVPVKNAKTGKVRQRPLILPDDVPVIAAALDRVKASLLIIDPLMSVLGGSKDVYRDTDIRYMLFDLMDLIEEKNIACIMARHLTKGGGENALYRGGGSIAIIGLVRTGLMVMNDPLDEQRNLLVHIKSNIGKIMPPQAYHIESGEVQGYEWSKVKWEGTTRQTMRDLMAPTPTPPSEERQELLAFLVSKYPTVFSPAEIAKELGAPDEVAAISRTLSRMAKANQIDRPSFGKYAAKAPKDHVS